jgi:plasmid stabilization system protein ParE
MRLELSRAAEADLAGIRDYTIGHYDADRAIAYLDAVEQASGGSWTIPKAV